MKMLSRLCSVLLASLAIILLVGALGLWPAARTEIPHNQPRNPEVRFSGERARTYLDQTSDGQSLMQALTVARFGLQWQEHQPGDASTAGGYLGMSHEQNLNAWFDADGVTVRSTLSEANRDQAWSAALRLKAYGYDKGLVAVPPIASRRVKENRIEYERSVSLPHSAFRVPQLVEWYENRAEGIEQGFTISERPGTTTSYRADASAVAAVYDCRTTPGSQRKTTALTERRYRAIAEANEPLRVLLAVSGDLRAQSKNQERIELVDGKGKGALSYSKLIAQDADGKRLPARMETNAEGREIALVVEDASARYPIVIDPVMATLEQKLSADIPQVDARFGTAVAIDGNMAVVGAWREDVGSDADVGAVYVFIRSGSTWALDKRFGSVSGAGQQCGMSVAISGNRIAYGCPGDNGTKGTAFYFQRNGANSYTGAAVAPGGFTAGDLFGTSIAINGNIVIVGAPGEAYNAEQNAGAAWISKINADGSTTTQSIETEDVANNRMGTAVALDSTYPGYYTAIIGKPGVGTGAVLIKEFDDGGFPFHSVTVTPPGGQSGDQFGQSVAVSGRPGANTAVIGAWGDDTKDTDAGAAYVFERVQNTLDWNLQQKLTVSDGRAFDYFSVSAVAIQDNTIVVGAYGWETTGLTDDTEEGAAYVFTRTGTVWTQQAQILSNDPQRGDQFGIGVGLSGDTVIAGARGANASNGTLRAGEAFVYRLSCVPPYGSMASIPSNTVCPGSAVNFAVTYISGTSPSFQWRKNGVNIPGATSNQYRINAATAADAGSYDVIVSNSCGSDISSSATLAVYTFSLNPTSQNFSVSGSNGIVNVTAPSASCNWTAVSNASFITVNSGSSGTGNGTVGFTVAANPDSGQRARHDHHRWAHLHRLAGRHQLQLRDRAYFTIVGREYEHKHGERHRQRWLRLDRDKQ